MNTRALPRLKWGKLGALRHCQCQFLWVSSHAGCLDRAQLKDNHALTIAGKSITGASIAKVSLLLRNLSWTRSPEKSKVFPIHTLQTIARHVQMMKNIAIIVVTITQILSIQMKQNILMLLNLKMKSNLLSRKIKFKNKKPYLKHPALLWVVVNYSKALKQDNQNTHQIKNT